MSRMRRHSKNHRTHRHYPITRARDETGRYAKKFSPQQKNKNNRQHIYRQQRQMNSRSRLPENRHAERIGKIRPGQFHVVSQFVWRDALQNQLSGIGIFTLIAFQRDIEQAHAYETDEEKNNQNDEPRPETN